MKRIEDCENRHWIRGGEGRTEEETFDDGERKTFESEEGVEVDCETEDDGGDEGSREGEGEAVSSFSSVLFAEKREREGQGRKTHMTAKFRKKFSCFNMYPELRMIGGRRTLRRIVDLKAIIDWTT
jgi:hypothetical protein